MKELQNIAFLIFVSTFIVTAIWVFITGHLYLPKQKGSHDNMNLWGDGDPTHLQGMSARVTAFLFLIPISFVGYALIEMAESINIYVKILSLVVGAIIAISYHYIQKKRWEKQQIQQ